MPSVSLNILLLFCSFFFILLALLIYFLWRSFRLRHKGIHKIDQMTGHQFEEYLEFLFGQLGYVAKRTKGSGDFGVDLILKKDQQTIAIQAKRYRSRVGLKAVQEVIAGKGYYRTDHAWVVTNSLFTKAAYELAKRNDVKLINRYQLIKMLKEIKA